MSGVVISNSKFSAPNLRLVAHQPWRRNLAIGLAVVGCVGALLIGYTLGQNRIVQQRGDSLVLQAEAAQSQALLRAAEAELVALRLANQVQGEAAKELREQLQAQHVENLNLSEEVTFYKSLMAPNEVQQGLKVQALELRQGDQQRSYSFELLLTQVALRRSYISGVVNIDFVGTQEGQQVVKSLTDLTSQEVYPLKFRFRYFQDLQGDFVVPEGFEPQKIVVTTKLKGKDAEQASFPWPNGES